MKYEELEILLKAIAILISLLITFIIKPYIDSKISEIEQKKLEEYMKVAIRCAEQIYTPEEWRTKKRYVVKYIQNLIGTVIQIDLTNEQIDTLIEGFVYQLKKE